MKVKDILMKVKDILMKVKDIDSMDSLLNQSQIRIRIVMKKYYTFIIGLHFFLGISAQISNDTIRKQILSLPDCKALVEAERGTEALPSLLYYKDTLSREQPIDSIKYTSVICDIIETYLQTDSLIKAASETEAFKLDTIPSTYAHIYYSLLGRIELGMCNYYLALSHAHQALDYVLFNPAIPALEYCKVLKNICWIYIELEESLWGNNEINYYLDAKWYIDEAISVFEEKVGSLDRYGINELNLLYLRACVYNEIDKRGEAKEIYEKIINAKNYNERNVWENAVNDRAVIHIKDGSPDKAIELFESISREDPYVLLRLAFAYYLSDDGSGGTYNHRQVDIEKLRKTLEKANKNFLEKCLDIFSNFAVAQREAYWMENNLIFMLNNNLIANRYPEIADVAFDNQLFLKNLNLKSIDIINKVIKGSSNEELKNEYGQVQALRDSITYGSIDNDSIVIYYQRLRSKEMALLNKIPGYRDTLSASFHKWNEIRDSLHEDEIIVDFTLTQETKGWKVEDFETYYGAFVLTKDAKSPVLVPLCKKDSIDEYLPEGKKELTISTLYQDSTIYTKIWGKLKEYIKDRKTIYFTPTGKLNLLNHNALVMPDSSRFGENYNLVRLSSIDKILCRKSINPSFQQFHSAIVYGGIKYDLTPGEMKEAATRSNDERNSTGYLKYTKPESDKIFRLLNSNRISTKLLQEDKANEESFKALSGKSPDIIHLATHGFYLDDQKKIDKNPFFNKLQGYSVLEDQLLFGGIQMAGAKIAWTGSKEDKDQISGIQDGVLTADEISRLDLSRTSLVVLSACETAKGYVDFVDGVFGLQRGFKKAGVGTILMSLWAVDDAATSLLMTQFYTYLTQGCERHEALWKAMMDVKEKHEEPVYWAGFVMLD